MKKKWIVSLLSLIGLFTWSYTAFASDDRVRQVWELQHDKSALFIKLFLSIVALVLYIGIFKVFILFLSYKEVFGSKNALTRILFNTNSLGRANSRNLKQDSFLQQYIQAIKGKTRQGITFGLDTNILMHYPNETFQLLRNEKITISKEVQRELDGLKNSSDKETSSNARRAFKALEDAQLQGIAITIVPSIEKDALKTLGLADTMDDRILAAYLQLHKQGKLTYFLTNDRGLKITARNSGMPIIEIEQSQSYRQKSWVRTVIIGITGLVLLLGLVGYNAYSFFQADTKIKQSYSISSGNTTSKEETTSLVDVESIMNQVNEDTNHIYHPNNSSEFIQSTEEGRAIYQTLEALTDVERASQTDELRNILKPLINKFYPQINVDKISDEEIQATFFLGQTDLRFGLAGLRWNADVSNSAVLDELIAIDASNVGLHLFESYQTVDAIVFEIISLFNYGPFHQ